MCITVQNQINETGKQIHVVHLYAFCTHLGSMTFDCGAGASGWAAVSLDEGWTRVGSALPPKQVTIPPHHQVTTQWTTPCFKMEEFPLWIISLLHTCNVIVLAGRGESSM